MRISTNIASLLLALVLCFTIVAQAEDIPVFSQRVDIPDPDGSGTAFIQLQYDTGNANAGAFAGYRIKALNFISSGTQQLKLWNNVNNNCNGVVLNDEDSIPMDGKVCFWSDNSVAAEFQNSFDFVAIGTGGDSTLMGTITLLNYNKQTCPGIPDLGTAGTFSAPPAPSVNIHLNGLQINFQLDTPYIRNETAWFLDFFDFNISPGGDSADGTGRTCANHLPASYSGTPFPDWWASAPRATYTSSVHPSINNALNDVVYPNYLPGAGEWSVASVDCDTVRWSSTIPISKLIRNTASDDCKAGSSGPAATPTSTLRYNANLYANAIRPRDASSSTAGYYKSTFMFPFSFAIQETVSNIGTISPKWSFAVSVLLLSVDRGTTNPGLTLQLQTTIDHPTLATPNVNSFSLLSEPHSSDRSPAPTLTRVGDNGNCDGTSTSACVITWNVFATQMSLAALSGSTSAFGLQYVGNWQFQWLTVGAGDALQASIYIDASATDPDIDLNTLPVNSSINFFKTRSDTVDLTKSGISSPTYDSGEQIWVRHSFQVDQADVTALTFTLKEAYVCWSNVPNFVPSLTSGQGCKADIPGVMEMSQGQRIVLYDSTSLSGGIPDVAGNSQGVQPKVWNWQLVGPNDNSWTNGEHVHSGFGINTLPLVTDDQKRNYFFHVVSTVSQTAKRGEAMEYHSVFAVRDTADRGWLSGVSIEGSSNGAAGALKPSALISWFN